MPRSTRQKRQPVKEPFVYRGTHEKIVREAIYPYYLLTAKQLTRLLHPTPKLGMHTTIKGRLYLLQNHNYLQSYALPTAEGPRPLVYLLGLYGEQALEAEGHEISTHHKLAALKGKSYSWQMHLLELNDFLIAAKTIEKSVPELYLFDWQHDLTIKKNPATALTNEGKKITVSPDGFLDLRLQTGGRACFLVELDRDTESNDKFKEKIRNILIVFEKGKLTEHFNAQKLTILFPTTAGERRVEQMRLLTRQVLKEKDIKEDNYKAQMFRFASVPPLMEPQPDAKTIFCTPLWVSPHGDLDNKAALIKLAK